MPLGRAWVVNGLERAAASGSSAGQRLSLADYVGVAGAHGRGQRRPRVLVLPSAIVVVVSLLPRQRCVDARRLTSALEDFSVPCQGVSLKTTEVG
jgi:hypothetical protein